MQDFAWEGSSQEAKLTASPTKDARSKWDSERCASANASQLSVALRLAAPTCAEEGGGSELSALSFTHVPIFVDQGKSWAV
jgi:hypothetical protein